MNEMTQTINGLYRDNNTLRERLERTTEDENQSPPAPEGPTN